MTQFKHKITGEIITVEKGKVIDMPARFLTDEWEEYEEPKEYWCIDTYTYEIDYLDEGNNEGRDNFNKEIGNYFSSREEAELAVRKLKAYKRLKDKGIEISYYDFEDNKYETTVEVMLDIPPSAWDYGVKQDLDIICGGEE